MKKSTLCKLLSTLLISIFTFGQFGVTASSAPVEYLDVDADGIVYRFEDAWIEGISFDSNHFFIVLGSISDVSVSVSKVNIDGIDVTDQIESVTFTVYGVTYENSAVLPEFWNTDFTFSVSINLTNGNSIEKVYTYEISAVQPK